MKRPRQRATASLPDWPGTGLDKPVTGFAGTSLGSIRLPKAALQGAINLPPGSWRVLTWGGPRGAIFGCAPVAREWSSRSTNTPLLAVPIFPSYVRQRTVFESGRG